jgi:twitching motility two-component system response regulator PilH
MAKILIAEDSETELRLIKEILKETSHEIITAADGEEAERKALEESVDMVILDVVMPKKNGFQVCRDLRTNKSFSTVPIIMVSSKNQESDKAWGLKQGATEYITKPFAPLDLLVAIKKHLKKRE